MCATTFIETFNIDMLGDTIESLCYTITTLLKMLLKLQTHHGSVIWLKLDHVFFKTDNDIYLCAKRKVPLSSSNAAIFGELEI